MADQHWHAYSYTGRERPEDRLRADLQSEYPPIENADWLAKPPRMIRATCPDVASAVDWLKGELTATLALPTDLPPERRLHWSEYQLNFGGDVVWGYYTNSSYVARAMIRCPRDGYRCPNL